MDIKIDKDAVKKFMRDLVTLRTVWIDRGYGRWVVRKKMHPVTRCICAVGVFLIGLFIYKGYFSNDAVNLNVAAAKNIEPEIRRVRNISQIVRVRDNEVLVPLDNLKPSGNLAKLPDKIDFGEPDTIIKDPGKMLSPSQNNDGAYRIYINKSEYTLSLFKGNELVKTYPVAVGRNAGNKQRVGDNRTPEGEFHIVSIENSVSWKHDFRDGKGIIKGAYGPWFLRLDANGWKGIGIHGTHDPDSVRTMATEGCIRLRNEDIRDLRQYAYKNMPVEIREN